MWALNHHDCSRSLFHKADVSGGLDCYQVNRSHCLIFIWMKIALKMRMIIILKLSSERRPSTSRPGSGTRQRTRWPPWLISTESRSTWQIDFNEEYYSWRNLKVLWLLFVNISFIGDHITFTFTLSFLCVHIFIHKLSIIPIRWFCSGRQFWGRPTLWRGRHMLQKVLLRSCCLFVP